MTTASACCDSRATSAQHTAPAIACSLGTEDFKKRVASIRTLAGRSLRRSSRTPLQLELLYSLDALTDVEGMVAKETECCGFLDFDLHYDDKGVRLTITAPVEALVAADGLFAHFAPELAREAA